MSLWGGILGGALQRGGEAWQVQSRDQALAEDRARLEAARGKMEMDRQTALESIRAKNNAAAAETQHGYRSDENIQSSTLATERAAAQNTYTDTRDKNLGAITAERDAANQTFVAGESSLDRAARIKAAGISSAGQNKPQLITLGDGSYVQLSTDGTVKPVTQDGVQLKGQKDLDFRTQTLIKTMQAEMQNPLITQERRDTINSEIRGLLKGDNGEAKTVLAPPAGAIEALRKNPDLGADFGKKYGADALANALKAKERVDLTKPTPGDTDKSTGILSAGKPDATKPGFKDDPVLTDKDREIQKEMDAVRARRDVSTARAGEVKAVTVDIISAMSPQEAKATLDRFGTELSGKQRAALNARIR